jgi:hypothetical protein
MSDPIVMAIRAAADDGRRTLNLDRFDMVTVSARKLALSLGIELRMLSPYHPLAKCTLERAHARMMGRRP